MQVGIGLVGMSSLLARNGSAKGAHVSANAMILGMALIVASQVVLCHSQVTCYAWSMVVCVLCFLAPFEVLICKN